jgi:creatinine amidohydrolase
MQPEVRYHMLRPAQVVARRQEFPVAYIPIGTLEWHGPHNPLGADTLQAEGLALQAATKGGGLVFPPLYYGENRLESLMEANAVDHEQIAEAMALPADNFTSERQLFNQTEQTLYYNHLLLHILNEAESLGFDVGVLVAGHYPLIDHARAAVHMFNQRSRRKERGMLAWAVVDYRLVEAQYPHAGDHAAGWETSHLLALYPDAVDLKQLPPKGEPLVGIMGADVRPPQDATASFGQEILDAAAAVLVRQVQHRLANKRLYFEHGNGMREDFAG